MKGVVGVGGVGGFREDVFEVKEVVVDWVGVDVRVGVILEVVEFFGDLVFLC